MESVERKLNALLAELKAGVQLIKKDAALLDLIHTTTKLQLVNAVGLLTEAQSLMNAYQPDVMEDVDYNSVLTRIGTFLTEMEKSKLNG